MKQQVSEPSRKPVVFIRAHTIGGVKYPVGTRMKMRVEKILELKKIVIEYNGTWPPTEKERINLKSIDNGKDDR